MVRCESVPSRENGFVSPNGDEFKDDAILQCNSGHILNGAGRTKCTANGTWSPALGNCQKPTAGGNGKNNMSINLLNSHPEMHRSS